MTIEEIGIAVVILSSIVAVCVQLKIVDSARRHFLRRRLDKHFLNFKEKLLDEVFNTADQEEILKIKEDFIEKLAPRNVKEKMIFSTAVESYKKSVEKTVAESYSIGPDLTFISPSPTERKELREGLEKEEIFKIKLYNDILYEGNRGE